MTSRVAVPVLGKKGTQLKLKVQIPGLDFKCHLNKQVKRKCNAIKSKWRQTVKRMLNMRKLNMLTTMLAKCYSKSNDDYACKFKNCF